MDTVCQSLELAVVYFDKIIVATEDIETYKKHRRIDARTYCGGHGAMPFPQSGVLWSLYIK